MKLSEILKPEDIAALSAKFAELAKSGETDAIKKVAEIVAVTTANRLGVTLEVDEW